MNKELDRQEYGMLSRPVVLFMINFAIIFIGYYMFFWRSITADAVPGYATGNFGYEQYTFKTVLQSVAGGRWVSGLVGYLQSFVRINWYENQWIAQIVKEIVCAIIPVRLTFLFKKEEKSNVFALNFLFLMCTLNVYIEEMFAFNTLEICLGWLLAFEAAILFCREKYVVSSVLTFLAIGVYQINFCIVAIVGLGWLLSQNGYVYDKKIFKKCIYLLLIVAIPAAISMALPSIVSHLGLTDTIVKPTVFDTAASAQNISIMSNVKRLAGFVFAFLFTSAQGMMPYGFVFAFMVLLYVVYFAEMKCREEKTGTIVLSLLYVTLFFVACFAIGVIQSVVSLPPRVLYGLFTGLAMLVYVVYGYSERCTCKYVIKYTTCLFGAVLFICVIISGIDHHTSNQLDITYAQQVQNEIDQYEEETGNVVTDIRFYYQDDDYYDTAYSNYMIHHYFVQSYNNSIYTTSWGAVSIIEWLSGRTYNHEELEEAAYMEIFDNPNWDKLDLNKQIIFDGSTMYWAIYLD